MDVIDKTLEFDEWFEEQEAKTQALVEARLYRIETYGHFGVVKHLGDGLYELKWKSGIRVYFAYLALKNILVLLGGSKNGQQKDIKKAKSFISKK